MKFNGKKIFISFLLIVIALILILGSSNLYNNSKKTPIVEQYINDVATFFSRGISGPTSALKRSSNNIIQLFNTYQENKKLTGKVDQISSDKIRIQNLQKENKELKSNLNLKNSLTNYKTTAAAVISRNPGNWNSELTINKGDNSDLYKNAPVLSSKGLIGKISQVNKTSSKVSLISNLNSDSDRFPVQITINNQVVNGIVSGYNSKNNRLSVNNVSAKTVNVKKGTLVETSGLGGVVPKGLYVGKVINANKNAYGATKNIYIQPASNLRDISNVLVTTNVGGR